MLGRIEMGESRCCGSAESVTAEGRRGEENSLEHDVPFLWSTSAPAWVALCMKPIGGTAPDRRFPRPDSRCGADHESRATRCQRLSVPGRRAASVRDPTILSGSLSRRERCRFSATLSGENIEACNRRKPFAIKPSKREPEQTRKTGWNRT